MLMSWNCRGVKKPTTVQRLKKLLRIYCPVMLFLCETKSLVVDVGSVLEPRCYFVSAGMDSQGKSGGLAFAIRKELSLTYFF